MTIHFNSFGGAYKKSTKTVEAIHLNSSSGRLEEEQKDLSDS